MEIFSRILQGALSAGASDVHLKVNSPVVFRVDVDIVPVEAPLPTTEWFDVILSKIVPERLRQLGRQDARSTSPICCPASAASA